MSKLTSTKTLTRRGHVRKSDLPSKVCPVCGLPFNWRRKWQRVWEEVRYCSERCRGQRRQSADF